MEAISYCPEGCALMGGLLSLYAAAFLYGDQYGRIQNKLEEWWLRLSDRQKLAVSWNTAFVREIAGLETRMFDRLFGKTLASFRAIGVSQCLSLASLGVAVLLGYVFSLLYDHRALSLFENLGFGSFTIVFTCLCFATVQAANRCRVASP